MSDIRAVTYEGAVATTPSDTVNDPAGPFAAMQCTGTGGLAKVHTLQGQDVSVYLLQGVVLTLAVTRVWSTGTAATSIIGLKAQPYVGPTG